jgi:LacI family transcriptional regulator, repressor for deo operon, udp, cdd, tsx, nupC, and nupG
MLSRRSATEARHLPGSRTPPGRVSLRDVAGRAGVSVRTVSNVVNGWPYVSDAMRARVQHALDELNYRPNLAARSLRTGRSGIIALALPAVAATYFSELAREIVKAGDRHSYTVLIEQTDSLPQRESYFFTGIGAHLVDGLILHPAGIGAADLTRMSGEKPLVLVGEHISGLADHVAIDNVAAARAATAHLVETGRKRIATIGCADDTEATAARMRYQGYRDALSDAGISVRPELACPCDVQDRSGGAVAMERLLTLRRVPDAVFCFNDLTAIGAIRTLLSRGYRVPDDVAVIGIDDIEDGRFMTPSLSTISPDKAQIANVAVDLLVSRIAATKRHGPREVEADFTLCVRESTVGSAAAPGQAASL